MLFLTIEFIAPSAPAYAAEGDPAITPLWSADGSAADSEAMAARNEAICARICAQLPDLQPAKDREDAIDVCSDDGLSQEQVLRRYHRMRVLAGPWHGGELRFEVYDQIAYLHAPVSARDAEQRGEYASALASLVELIVEATGMTPRMPGNDRAGAIEVPAERPGAEAISAERSGAKAYAGAASVDAKAVATATIAAADRALTRMQRMERSQQLYRRLGTPSLVVLSLVALLIGFALLSHGIERGSVMASADPDKPATFLAQSMPPPHYRLGLFPQFALQGRIAETGEAIELPVFREQYLRAGLGAPFTVLRTTDPRMPYVLRNAYDNATPLVRIGSIGLAWHTWLALVPPVLLYLMVLRPLLRVPAGQRPYRLADVTRKLRFVVLVAGVAASVILIKRFL